ncbi:MAG: RHS repeat-associated core domain-containing protein [Fimbriimonadaceae bacterium]|nr:RHS repeat-associated core domain-containing protein [Fimbriimonadaceae bacterium]
MPRQLKRAHYRYRVDGMRVSKREGVTLGVNITEETVSGYYDVYATDRPTTRYYHDGQSGYEEVYTRKVNSVDTVDVVRYGLGPRGIESQRVFSGAVGGSLPQTALGFPVYDTHGNNVAMLALDGSVAHERTYSPWGDVVSSNGSPPQQGYCANLGHRQDAESSLIYMRARYYEPATGRFLSEDPARDGTNWYAYCISNPTNLVDRSGKLPDDPWHALGEFVFHMGNVRAQLGLLFIGLGAMQMYLGFSAILGRLSAGAAKILLAYGKGAGTILSAWGIFTMASGANTFARGLMMMQAGKILMALGEDGWEYASTLLFGASGGFGLPDLLADWYTGSDDGLWRR